MSFLRRWFGKKEAVIDLTNTNEPLDCVILDENYNEISNRQRVFFRIAFTNDMLTLVNIREIRFTPNTKGAIASSFLLLKNNKPIQAGLLTNTVFIDSCTFFNFPKNGIILTFDGGDENGIINSWIMKQVMD